MTQSWNYLSLQLPWRSLLLWLIAAMAALWLQGCASTTAPTSADMEAPAFTLTAADGEAVSLSDYVGEQPVLLYFHMAVG